LNEKIDKLKYIRLSKLEDLVRLSIAHGLSLMYHFKTNNKHVYFVHIVDTDIVSLVITDVEVKKKYLVYNTFEDKITLSDKFNPSTKSSYIKILEVEEQNIIPEELLHH